MQQTPGWKTKGFWFVLVANIVAVLFALGVNPDSLDPGPLAKGVGLIATLLMSAGYAVVRGRVKEGDPGKPWWKRSEFWLSIVAVVVATLLSADIFVVGGTVYKILGVLASGLAILGYKLDPKELK